MNRKTKDAIISDMSRGIVEVLQLFIMIDNLAELELDLKKNPDNLQLKVLRGKLKRRMLKQKGECDKKFDNVKKKLNNAIGI